MRKWIAGLVVLAVILIVIAADTDHMPKFIGMLYKFPFGDKAGHFLLMGLLAYVVNAALFPREVPVFGRSYLLGTFIIVVVVTLEEASQSLFPTRSVDIFDLLASYLGIFCANWIIPHRRNTSQVEK